MKPWNNPLMVVYCYICGEEGYNLRASDDWRGELFRCSNGCNPSAVSSYQKAKIKNDKRQQTFEHGDGI